MHKQTLTLLILLAILAACSPVSPSTRLAPTLPPAASLPPTHSPSPASTPLAGPAPTQTLSPLPAPPGETMLLLSPDGQWTAVLDREAGNLEVEGAQSTRQVIFPAGSTASQVEWSPDSQRLAVVLSSLPDDRSSPRDRPPEIRLFDLDGGSFQESASVYPPEGSTDLASSPEQVILGDWSPDSQRILFWPGPLSASIQADGLSLWVLDTETMQASRLSEATLVNPDYQSWAPDGSALVFTDGGYRSAPVNKWLSLYEVKSGQVSSLLARSEFIPGAVVWSPAGDVIAFAAVRANETGAEWADRMSWDNPAILARRIYLLDPQAGECRRLNAAETFQDAPRWSADGKTLYYVSIDGDQAVIMAADPETGEAEPLDSCRAPLPSAAGYFGQVDWTTLYENCTLPPTHTPASPTQYPATSVQQDDTRFVELFKIEGDCQPPCWGGITPGSTTWEEAGQILGRMGASLNTWDYPGGSAGYTLLPVPALAVSQKIATSVQLPVTIYASEGIVQQIIIEGPVNFPDYTLPGLLSRYGPPAEVLISTTNRPGSAIIPFFLILFYPEHGLMAKFLDLTEVKDDQLMGCFHYTPGPVLHFFPTQEDATFSRVYEALTTGSAGEYQPLQEVTALDVSKFTERLKDSDYPCVQTPAKFWPVR